MTGARLDGAGDGASADRAFADVHSAPTALRIMLGSQLRQLREANNLTREQAAAVIRASGSKIGRLELGRNSFKQRDVADLLTLYKVTDPQEREALLALARQSSVPGWWHQYSDILSRWVQVYVGLEAAASIIRVYEQQFIHGLLQTEDYARSVILITNKGLPAAEIERRVDLRVRRQEVLTGPSPLTLWCVLDEAVLRRPVGTREVMRTQLKRLLEVMQLPNVTLQIIPFSVGAHAAAGGPFTILRFSEPDLPDVVYLEQLRSSLYVDKRDDVGAYAHVMDQLTVQASSPAATRRLLAELLQQI
jgi:transcriptional regulator with XRE-family HTH domain